MSHTKTKIIKENTFIDHRKILHEWETPEFIPMQRGKIWYLTASVIFTLILIYALATSSITMTLAFIGAAIVFVIVEKRPPQIIRVQITDLGIFYKKNFYPYHELNAFWIVYHPPYAQALYLRLRKKKRFVRLKIELNQENPIEIRKLLMKEIPEIEGANEPMIDILTRLLRLQ